MSSTRIPSDEFVRHWHAAMRWLLAGISYQRGQGAPAYASRWRYPLQGWSPSYPETTGYLIETLLHPRVLQDFPEAEAAARSCVDWLLQVQASDGSFPSGYAGSGKPSVFNTSQVLLGLLAAAAHWEDSRYEASGRRAFTWLVQQLDEDGLWRGAAYVPGHIPSYYTRALWPMLLAVERFQQSSQEPLLRTALQQYKARWRADGSVRDWGFTAGAPAPTHTIAYTLRGMLECGVLLQDEQAIALAERGAHRLSLLYEQEGRLAGAYRTGWKGDYRYLCVTGNLQLSCFMHRMVQTHPDERYGVHAHRFLADALPAQRLGGGSDRYGAVPGSVPFYGAYMPLRYPGWAAKFLVDACVSLPN